MTKTVSLVFLALLPLLLSGHNQTSDMPQNPDEHVQRHARYLQFQRQVFHTHEDPDSGRVKSIEKVEEIQSQLHKLISAEISFALSMPHPSVGDVEKAINSVRGESRDLPFADLFQLNSVRTLAVAYVILRGVDAIPDTQPYLEFYDDMNGAWEMKAEAPTRSDFPGHTFFVSKMDSSVPGEAWFLAWGTTIGNPGTPMNVRLYAFNGNAVRTVWKRDDLTRGVATVSKDSVTLEYDQEYNSSDPNNRVHETLHVSPNGLQ